MNPKVNLKDIILLVFGLFFISTFADGKSLDVKVNPQTGSISNLKISLDAHNMDWLVKTDGTQYAWITEEFGWGLGYLTISNKHETCKYEWTKPTEMTIDGMKVVYRCGNIRIEVKRNLDSDDLVERYTFINDSREAVSLYDIGIYIPLNDNYPDAKTCLQNRANVHIWEGENAAYVNACRMNGKGPHLGLVVTDGAVNSYEVWERGVQKANSQYRGIFALNLPDMYLRPGMTYSVEWHVFAHNGNNDFKRRLKELGSVLASCNKYVFQKGETLRMEVSSERPLKNVSVRLNGVPAICRLEQGKYILEAPLLQLGELRVDFFYNGGKRTHVDCLVISGEEELLKKRVEFIRTHQQMNNKNDARYGAYMVYDNEGDSIYLNNIPNCNPVDRDEGAELVGMGVLLAKQYRLTGDEALKKSLLKYATFLREKLQTKDYVTYSSVDQTNRNRGYNYMWVADFYFQMFQATGNRQYALDGYETLRAMFRQFGHGFYAIGIPVELGLQSLKKAGLEKEYKILLEDFEKTAGVFLKNSLNYPKHEVNYEQSIVAPAIQFLAQLYLVTKEKKYLDEVKRQMPVLEAFNGFQPSYHLNEISVRHWDGYWFGKHEMFGDTFPHYWSSLTGAVYHYYARCTGDYTYQLRAENIVRNNLCLFFEDGKASCAYLYPHKIDGVKARFYDPYANDQDWALVYYLLVNKNL